MNVSTVGQQKKIGFALRSSPVLVVDGRSIPVQILAATVERFEVRVPEDLDLEDEAHLGFFIATPVSGRVVMRSEITDVQESGSGINIIVTPMRIVTRDGGAVLAAFLKGYLGVPKVDARELRATAKGGVLFPMDTLHKPEHLELPKTVRITQDVGFHFGPIAANGHQCPGRVYEVTEDGLSLITGVNPAQGDNVRLMFPLPDGVGQGAAMFIGRVVWVMPSHSGTGFGVKLDEGQREQHKILTALRHHYLSKARQNS